MIEIDVKAAGREKKIRAHDWIEAIQELNDFIYDDIVEFPTGENGEMKIKRVKIKDIERFIK